MPPVEMLSLWIISILQVTVCLLTPTALVALANIQTQRARVLANAVNLHNRAQYNAALARSKANLAQLTGNNRLTRDTKVYFPNKEETAEQSKLVPKEKFQFNPANGSVEELPIDDNFFVDEKLQATYRPQENEQSTGYTCALQDNEGATQEDQLKISINLANDLPESYNPMIDIRNSANDDRGKTKSCTCQNQPRESSSVQQDEEIISSEPICPICGQRIRSDREGSGSRQANNFDFFNAENREFNPDSEFLRPPEELLQEDDLDNFIPDFIRTPNPHLLNKNGFLHTHILQHELRPLRTLHGNVITPPMSVVNVNQNQQGFIQPSSTTFLPVSNGVGTFGNQNFHGSSSFAAIPAQVIPSGATHTQFIPSGLNTHILNDHGGVQIKPVIESVDGTSHDVLTNGGLIHQVQHVNTASSNTGINQIQNSVSSLNTPSLVTSGGVNIKPVFENVDETSHVLTNGGAINQAQHVGTASSNILPTIRGINQIQNAVTPGNQGLINQDQMIFSGREAKMEPRDELVGEPLQDQARISEESSLGDKTNNKDEMVSTFHIPSIHIDPSNYHSDFPINSYSPRNMDPTKPQNRQPFVKYIEDEQKSINELLRFLERSNHQNYDSAYTHGYYGQPEHIPKIKNYHLHHIKQKKHHSTPSSNYGKPNHSPPSSYYPTTQDYAINIDEVEDIDNDNPSYFNAEQTSNNYDDRPEENNQEESQENNVYGNNEGDSDYEPSYQYRTNSHSSGRTSEDSVVGAPFNERMLLHHNGINPTLPQFAQPHSHEQFVPRTSEFDQETQQKLITKYFEDEQKYINDAWNNIQTEHQKRFENLMHALNQNSEISNINHEFPLGQSLSEKVGDTENAPINLELRQSDTENEDMLTKLIQNDPNIQQQIGFEHFNQDPTLGYIFAVPPRQQYESYRRHVRSLDSAQLKNLLVKEQEIVDTLKKYADHNQDLMMIGYLGNDIIDELKQKRNRRKHRMKRQVSGKDSWPWARLIKDPKFKMDVEKTLGNLGAATKSAFEYENAPMHHVKNMVGSAKDAVMSAMKIPSQQFIIPTSYQIVPTETEDKVAGINPSLLSEDANIFGKSIIPSSNEEFGDTFQKVGSVIQNSVLSGQETLEHIGEAANHAKKALHSTRYVTPRMIMKKIPTLTKDPMRQAMIIAPKIFDFSDENNIVGTTLRGDKGVSVGNIMDAVGLSNPNTNLELEKITIQPRGPVLTKTRNSDDTNNNSNNYGFSNIRIEKIGNINDDFVGDTLNALHEAQLMFGVNSLRDFFRKLRNNVKSLVKGNRLASSNRNVAKKKVITGDKTADERVGISLIPQGAILHPFMSRVSESQVQEFLRNSNYPLLKATQKSDHSENHHDIGPIVGAINPVMFERIFNESVYSKNDNPTTPHDVFHHTHNRRSDGQDEIEAEDKENVSTFMKVHGALLKPFMGKVNEEKFEKFYKHLKPNYEENDYESNPEFNEYRNEANEEYASNEYSSTREDI